MVNGHYFNDWNYVLEDNNKVIGHMFCRTIEYKNDNLLTDIKTLYLDDICVLDEYRGMGVATKLYEHIKEYLDW